MRAACGILVGGASRRMGRPKALIRIEGRTLLERTVEAALGVFEEVVLLGRPAFDLPESLASMRVLPDGPIGAGPMVGLASLVDAFPESLLALVSCDLPRLDARLLTSLIQAAQANEPVDAIVPATGAPPDGWEPCCAIYGPSIVSALGESLREGEYSLQRLLGLVRVRTILLSANEAAKLVNVNEPADLARFGISVEDRQE